MVTRRDVAPPPLIHLPPASDEPGGVVRGEPLPPRAELVGIAVSFVLVSIYLATPPLGTDLSAQLARAGFAAAHPATPVDLSWFGGTETFSYSVLSPYVMAVLGVHITGGLCCVLASWLLARLFVRTGARRPALGAGLGAVLQVTNLVDGRVTFALGTVFALAALVALTSRWSRPALPSPPGRRSSAACRHRWRRTACSSARRPLPSCAGHGRHSCWVSLP